MRDYIDPTELEAPLRRHPLGECIVCGAQIPPGWKPRLCAECRKELQRLEREKWWGKSGPDAIFIGLASAKRSFGILLTEGKTSTDILPFVPQIQRGGCISWEWNPQTQQWDIDENPPQDVGWLFWKDKDNGVVKSEVFWGMGKLLQKMSELEMQGHDVYKAGIKRFPITRRYK